MRQKKCVGHNRKKEENEKLEQTHLKTTRNRVPKPRKNFRKRWNRKLWIIWESLNHRRGREETGYIMREEEEEESGRKGRTKGKNCVVFVWKLKGEMMIRSRKKRDSLWGPRTQKRERYLEHYSRNQREEERKILVGCSAAEAKRATADLLKRYYFLSLKRTNQQQISLTCTPTQTSNMPHFVGNKQNFFS